VNNNSVFLPAAVGVGGAPHPFRLREETRLSSVTDCQFETDGQLFFAEGSPNGGPSNDAAEDTTSFKSGRTISHAYT
jgi:hypothetical protein